MKLTTKLLLPALAAALAASSSAFAHDFWASVASPVQGQPATVVFGYGHGFPDTEAVEDADFDARFSPPVLKGPGGDVPLRRGGDAMTYVSQDPLGNGTYTAATENRPSFGSSTPDGYRRGSRKDNPTATSCGLSRRYGKETVALGGPASGFEIPLGQALEIVPLADPTRVKVRTPFPVKVLFNGRPLPGAEITAFFAGFSPRNAASAFAAQTDRDGVVNIIPLAAGRWLARVGEEAEYADLTVCDRESWVATFTFTVTE
ncbi:MAG: DUF4198 domain-containing protein [Deltaproteobacteria bacterium]|jgi:uncharacterized GH25 family protein|nr:DUF4198 domain-containing protein [Deltaproteobacteria bacterium]